jgi:peptidoglycan hydrolase-like protein with peptidoglycan-binding domain
MSGSDKPRLQRRRWPVAGAIVCAVVLAGGGIAVAAAAAVPEAAAERKTPPPATAAIERGTLSGSRTVAGVLDYTDSHDLQAGIGGVLTHLPGEGGQVGLGGELYRVDNVPVHLLRGSTPAWRAFESGMSDGPDVQQLESSLREMGFFSGEPDERFDWRTRAAIEKWQKSTGQEQTGRIDFGRIVFTPTDLRIGGMTAAVGDNVGPGAALYRVSGLDKQVSGDVKLADQAYAQVGAAVQINLPQGVTTTGTITSVGQPEEREKSGQMSTVIPITVALDDPAAAEGLSRANVTVELPSDVREDVLSVPVDALLALPGGSFGVEQVAEDGTTRQVPVEVGLFAGGRVEISGDGLQAGDDVVVPER